MLRGVAGGYNWRQEGRRATKGRHSIGSGLASSFHTRSFGLLPLSSLNHVKENGIIEILLWVYLLLILCLVLELKVLVFGKQCEVQVL